jgi:DNA-directed RNA polymerase subunit alpha
LPIDAIYSPVTRVNYFVEPTRVGQQTELDRLVIEISTNGAMAPGTALGHAARIMTEYLQLFTEVGEAMQVESFEAATSDTNRARDIKIDDLDFSVRTYNCLKRQGIETLDELKNYTEDELMNIRNFGSKSYDEVKDKLNEYGFELRPSPSSAAMEELEV